MLFNARIKSKLEKLAATKNLGLDSIRFLIAGLLNTFITLVIYELALFFCSYQIAYLISWLVGIVIAIYFYPSKVFVGSENGVKSKICVGLIYIFVFLCGLMFMNLMSNRGIPAQLLIVIVMVFTTLLNFILMRFVLRTILAP